MTLLRGNSFRLIVLLLAGLLTPCGCASPWSGRSASSSVSPAEPATLPDRYTLTQKPLWMHSDFALPEQHDLLAQLSLLRADMVAQLALPNSEEPIHVYLFQSAPQFAQYVRLKYPAFPNRRAFFVQTAARLSIFAQWGDHVTEDLRHETTHACLHAALPDIPLWLDEGLAKCYEPPRDQRGLNRGQLDWIAPRLQRGQWQPNLRRLEAFSPTANIGQDDYAECWAWVHFLLQSRAEHAELLRGYLADICRESSAQRGASIEPLSSRLERQLSQPSVALLEHLRTLPVATSR
jgi:hypothetical protein